jgi:hypothetical protein
MKLHIQGMGIIGSLLALKLSQQGQAFTWDDNESAVNAWQASTGCIYPSGDDYDHQNWAMWRDHYFGAMPELESATYCFLSKRPPHGGKYKFERIGPWGIASQQSFHLNAQCLVRRVRIEFEGARCVKAPAGSVVIVSHGFGARLDRYLWGWNVKVQLDYVPQHRLSNYCFYMRVGRFKLAYAYPVPMEPGWHYAGSSLISQHVPRQLEIEPKFVHWLEHVGRYTDLKVKACGERTQGWRPVAAPEDTLLLKRIKGQWCIRPQWSSGIRHAPVIVARVLEKIL